MLTLLNNGVDEEKKIWKWSDKGVFSIEGLGLFAGGAIASKAFLIQIIFHLIVLNKLELRFRRKSDRDTLILMMILISVAEPADPGLWSWPGSLAQVTLEISGHLSHAQHVDKLRAQLVRPADASRWLTCWVWNNEISSLVIISSNRAIKIPPHNHV